MTNLSSYVLAIAASHAFEAFLSAVFICNFMQFSVQPLLWIMPCLTAFRFFNSVFHRSQKHTDTSKFFTPGISFPLNLTANFYMIALPMLLTNILIGSAIKDNSMLKDRFANPGMMMLPLPKFGTSPEVIGSGQFHWGCASQLPSVWFPLSPGLSQRTLRAQFHTIARFRVFHFGGCHLMWTTMVIIVPGLSVKLLPF